LTDLYYHHRHEGCGWQSLGDMYPYKTCPGLKMGGVQLSLPHPVLAWNLLLKRYDAMLVSGWAGGTYLLVHLLCWLNRTPVVVLSDTYQQKDHGCIFRLLRDVIVKLVCRRARAAVAAGTRAGRYLKDAGFRGYLGMGYYAVDTDEFIPVRLGHDGSLEILFVARLIGRKRIVDLLEAAARIKLRGVPVRLTIVGDGPCRDQAEQLVSKLSLNGTIRFAGDVRHVELPVFMHRADALVLPSSGEPWGVVVAEAAACGLVLVVSDEVGAGYDLVRHGENGYVFPAGDVEALSDALVKLWDDKQAGKLPAMGRISRGLAERFDTRRCAEVYARVIRHAANSRGSDRDRGRLAES